MDLIFINGDVHTLDQAGSQAEAVAVRDGKIVAVGTTAEVGAKATAKTEVIDLKGKTLLPGFIDAHNHMVMYGLKLTDIDCQGGKIRSIADLTEEVGRRVKRLAPGEWIGGWGYDDTKLAEKRHPTRWDFDKVAPDNPVACDRICAHMMVVNSKALELAGISRETADPVGGEIFRDGSGEPTGVLKDTAGDLIKKIIPVPSVHKIREGIKQAGQLFNRDGVTGVHEAGAGFTIPGPYEVRAYQQAFHNGDLSVRVYMMVYTDLIDELAELGFYTGFGNDYLKIGSFKMFLDGNIALKGAAVETPYVDGTKGLMRETEESLTEKMRKIHRAGFQIAIHAIGDRASNTVLNVYEKILQEYPRRDHRHRIEHFILTTPAHIERAKKLAVIPVVQPGFIYYNAEGWIKNLGEERVEKQGYPLRDMLAAGLTPPASTDCPVIPISPLRGIETAVARQICTGRVIAAGQAITVDQALRMYTNYSAYASFEENIKGSIEVGKLADFAVLGASPYRVKVTEIASIPVLMTVVGGKIVYSDAVF